MHSFKSTKQRRDNYDEFDSISIFLTWHGRRIGHIYLIEETIMNGAGMMLFFLLGVSAGMFVWEYLY